MPPIQDKLKNSHREHIVMKKMVRYINQLLLLCLLCGAVIACPDNPPSDSGGIQTVYDFSNTAYPIPESINDLYIPLTTHQKDVVVLVAQGGPVTYYAVRLEDGVIVLGGPTGGAPANLSMIHALAEQYEVVMVNQIQVHYDDFDTIFLEHFDDLLTPQFTRELNNQNAEIIVRVAHHFKQQGKKVYLIGGSYGALLVQYVLHRYYLDLDLFDKIAIGAGRVQIEAEFRDAISNDTTPNFVSVEDASEDGISETLIGTIEKDATNTIVTYEPLVPLEWWVVRLGGDIMVLDYEQIYGELNLPKEDYWYFSAEYDSNIGKLNSAEIEIVKTHFNYSLAQQAVHSDWLSPTVATYLIPFFEMGTIPPATLQLE